MKRREFLQLTAAVAGVSPVVSGCKQKRKIPGSIVGASAAVGHLLRDGKIKGEPTTTTNADVVIIGGGISGLSAARWLTNSGITNFIVLDLEKEMGGNAASGANEISPFPWGAHYVPTPNNNLAEYLSFLQECNVITQVTPAGLPVYNEYYLCFDPQERLYINGRWQDGLVPTYGVPDEEQKQLSRFFDLMGGFRYRKGQDGKDAFAIPVDDSSKDEIFTNLDKLTMKHWLEQQQFNSSYLHWYVNYCTRDDFGTPYDSCSAWAGIHYFAARKGRGVNADHQDVITWPQGNAFLAAKLRESYDQKCQRSALVLSVTSGADGSTVKWYDVTTGLINAIEARQVIMAVPQFVASRLLGDASRLKLVNETISYSPWMVANLKVKSITERDGAPLSWDNVLYQGKSLGYVHASQQLLQQQLPLKNLTYYLPLTEGSTTGARKAARDKPHNYWVEEIVKELRIVHPDIEDSIINADIMIWGHAMAQPLPGMIHGSVRNQLQQSVQNKIHFAHTDLAGISIFEEAFYQGIRAAKKVITQLNNG